MSVREWLDFAAWKEEQERLRWEAELSDLLSPSPEDREDEFQAWTEEQDEVYCEYRDSFYSGLD